MSYSSYSDYKDSGVAWIGQIPSHWTKARLKFMCKVQTGNRDTVHASPDGAYPFFIRSPKVSRIDSFSFDCEAILTPGDGDVGNIFHHVNGKFDFHQRVYMMNQFKKVYPRFFYYYMRGMFICVAKDGSAKTTVDSLRLPTLHNFWFALPKIQEQESIANFLDRETARIDKLIAEKQNFIKLLKEKRQALISHVVTKGLDPNVKMKDSGIEWIGQVPKHWQVGALGYYANLNTGSTPDRNVSEYWGGNIPWVTTGEVKYNTILESQEFISELGLSKSSVKISPPGTLLMAMYGQGVTRGRVAILGIPAAYNQACVAISPDSRIFNEYLKYFYIAAYKEIRITGNLTSQMNLNVELVGKFKILIPPIKEQHEIVSFINAENSSLDTLEKETEISVAILKEHRTALISAAVTGKIDVRHNNRCPPNRSC